MSDEEYSSGDESENEVEELHQPKLNEGDSDESDKELEIAYKTGLLKPGLYSEAAPDRPVINNVEAILGKLEEIEQKKLDWPERLDITVERRSREDDIFSEGLSASEAQAQAQSRLFTVHNDFKRELMFITQAKDAVLKAIPMLKEAGIPTTRPEDYFAEMAKKDGHMKKVREKLLTLQRRKDAADKYRNQLKLKKYGKKVQQAVESERRKKKKDILDSVKKFRKGKKDNMDFLDDDKSSGGRPGKPSQMQKMQQQQRKKSRTFRDKKFGFGGRKKGMKTNTTNSTNEISRFKQKRPPTGKNNNNNKRLGKGRRQKMNNRNKR